MPKTKRSQIYCEYKQILIFFKKKKLLIFFKNIVKKSKKPYIFIPYVLDPLPNSSIWY